MIIRPAPIKDPVRYYFGAGTAACALSVGIFTQRELLSTLFTLAFALSFDEVIVTTYRAGQRPTLPIWMLTELVRPRQRPVTNVVAVFVIAVTFIPILLAYYLSRDTVHIGGAGK